MGMRFKKSIKIAPGVKLNLNKKSVGMTVGGKGLHYTVNSKGRKTTTVGIPGTGLSYSSTSSRAKPNGSKNTETVSYEKSDKSKSVALLLCIFLGYIGIHRFYAGKIGTGIIWFLTAGCFGIGWICDIITISSGNFIDGNNKIITN